ncbi:hypothetical protein CANARDRAFT_29578 [[Candida] arabinofermentans NRRL YB-2248]|uniref:Cleavage and polyadenylation specificity factor subunit 2 n=1 Tax=[Candida] arabinofermentans NRRL YB-2248 TaxID=983967 RepID=A0A1E4SWI7_9ASCO|nr:hypothetical protein CANARDRAFT_29578 [[Candida] arabinofermentans NRRL YB-2248]
MFEFISLAPPVESSPPKKEEIEDDDDDAYDPFGSDNEDSLTTSDQNTNSTKTQARILSFDNNQIHILADPGWDGKADLSYLDEMIPKIDIIILSHPTTEYIGAFALLLHRYPLLRRIKTYATLPIAKLGRLATAELYRSVGLLGALENSELEVQDVENCFNSITTLNYAQSISLQGNLSGITITAYNSGHTLGGSCWLLTKEAEKIVYAPAWNHAKDSFLNAGFLSTSGNNIMRPTTLISGSDLGSGLAHKKLIEKFLNLVELTLINGTSILLPTSITGRIFELLPLLDQKIHPDIPLYVVSFTGIKSLQYSANMLEWMQPDITKKWESQSQNQNQTPFDSTRLKLITIEDLNTLEMGPKIVFVDGVDMNEGSLSRTCFMELCSKQNTALILTERPELNSTAYEILKSWETKVKEDENLQDGSLIILQKELPLTVIKEEPLRGSELNFYNRKVAERRQRQKEIELEERKNENLLDTMIGEDDDDDDDDDDDELIDGDDENDEDEDEDDAEEGNDEVDENGEKIKKKKVTTTTAAVLNQSIQNSNKGKDENATIEEILKMPMDFDVRTAKGKNRMFPFILRKVTVDDYGEVIKHDDFMREEEKFSLKKSVINPNLGEDESEYETETEDENDGNENGNKKRGANNAFGSNRRRRKRPRSEINMGESQVIKRDTLYNLDPLLDPKSRTSKIVKVGIRCGLTFIDLSGIADLRSMKITFNILKPRKVILLPNTTYGYQGDATSIIESMLLQQQNKLKHLYSQNASSSLGTDYIKCKLNEQIDLGSVITSYNLELDPELNRNLNWQSITGGQSIAYVYGEITESSSSTENSKKSYVLKAPVTSTMIPGLNSISIGDVKLTELRKKLNSLNHIAEFKGDGTLVIDDIVTVRKVGDGTLIIDGGISRLFYQVKEMIGSMLAYV